MTITLFASAAVGATFWLLAWGSFRVAGPIRRRLGSTVAVVLAVAGAAPVGLAGYLAARLALAQPGPEERTLADGVTYRRTVLTTPRRVVVHVVEADLTRGHRLAVSPPAEGTKSRAAVASRFADAIGCDLAVNANFFYPFRDNHLFDYAPHEGDLVQPVGTAIGDGVRYGKPGDGWVTFWSEPGGRVGFGDPPAGADAAVAGMGWLVSRGAAVANEPGEPYPRTALAVDARRERLWLVVVDGKQPRYSEGLTLTEVSDLLIRLGASDAIQLDGGGSSVLVAPDASGRPAPLSRPSHTKIPGRQRPIANILGLKFRR